MHSDDMPHNQDGNGGAHEGAAPDGTATMSAPVVSSDANATDAALDASSITNKVVGIAVDPDAADGSSTSGAATSAGAPTPATATDAAGAMPADGTTEGAGPAARDLSTLVDAREPFQSLVQTIWRLRQPDGCPWDREQTHESIAGNMVEEAYEAACAIEDGDPGHLCEELGDVLMQVVLQAQIAADAGEFTLVDVVRGIDEKLVRRHPHVFGDASASDPEAVRAIWDSIKLAEKEERDQEAEAAHERPAGLLDGVPRGMPALMEAQKVSRKAAAAGFEWDGIDDVWDAAGEERGEFLSAEPGSAERAMEFGDLLFALVNVARWEGIDAEEALHASTLKFRTRWASMEETARQGGSRVEDLSHEELSALWAEAKRAEAAAGAEA